MLSAPVVAIHQPNFLPWLGYWCKLAASDRFILHDNCPLSRTSGGSFTVRVLGGGEGSKWMRLPVERAPLGTSIDRTRVVEPSSTSLVARLAQRYRRRPYLDELLHVISTASVTSRLATYNGAIVRVIAAALCPHCELLLASDLDEYSPGPSHLATLTAAAGGRTYLSGWGGRKYLPGHLGSWDTAELVLFDAESAARSLLPTHQSPYESIAGRIAERGLSEVRDLLAEVRGRRLEYCSPFSPS